MQNRKRLLRIIILIIGTAVSVYFIPWILLRALLTPLPNTVQEQVNDALKYKLDGIIVYVDEANKTPEFYAAGWKDRENEVPADAHDLFKIASISKLYIAAAAAKLINNNTLSLDKTLTEYLPGIADSIENADEITFRMLLQHRSGIPDWIDDSEFSWGDPPKDVRKILNLVLGDPAEFKPDARYDYSNTNYLLIGDILDKELGYSHNKYIKTEILEPLGLKQTFGLLSDVDSTKVVSGYDIHYQGDVKMLDFVSPGGSMVATARDVGIFLRALNDGSLLNDEEQKIYTSVYQYGHTGLLPGYMSIARYHKDQDMVVVQFINTSGGKAWSLNEIIYKRILRIIRK